MKSMPKFLYATLSTIIDLVIGLWAFYSLLLVTGLFSRFEPLVTTRLFSAYLVTALAGWVLYLTAWSTRVDDMESFSTSTAGEMPNELKGADSINEVGYRQLLNDVYLNGAATVYKSIAIFIGAAVGTWVGTFVPLLGILFAVTYAPTDYRAGKIRWWLSPTMIAMAVAVGLVYGVAVIGRLVVTRGDSVPIPNILSLIGAIRPIQFSTIGFVRHLFSAVRPGRR